MRIAVFTAIAAALALGACVQGPASQPPPGPTVELPKEGAGSCDAARFAACFGRRESELDLSTAPRLHRVVCADCAMTMDFSADRLTIYFDVDRKVARLACQ
jgi:hypothetical protein